MIRMVFTNLPLRRSIPFGVAAYVVGYLLTVVTVRGYVPAVMAVTVTGRFVESATLGEIFGVPPSPRVVGGWLFYNAQFIPTSVPTADAINGFSFLTNRSLLLAVDGMMLGLFLVPLVILIAAGYLTVRTGPVHGVHGETYGGASVALGYVPLLIIGAFVFTASVPGASSSASPAGIPTIFIGIVYATAAGAIGGKIGSMVG